MWLYTCKAYYDCYGMPHVYVGINYPKPIRHVKGYTRTNLFLFVCVVSYIKNNIQERYTCIHGITYCVHHSVLYIRVLSLCLGEGGLPQPVYYKNSVTLYYTTPFLTQAPSTS